MKGQMIGAVAGGAMAASAIFALGAWSGATTLDSTAKPTAVESDSTASVNSPTAAVPRYADIIKVAAVKRYSEVPREVCTQQAVTRQLPPQDAQRTTGKLLGAVIGGVVGHQFGGGSGKDAATVGGAILGGVLGDKIQKQQQAARTYTTMETQCSTQYDSQEKVIGYDVTYRLDGHTEVIRLGYQPEPRVPVENNQIVFLPYGGAAMTPVKVALAY